MTTRKSRRFRSLAGLRSLTLAASALAMSSAAGQTQSALNAGEPQELVLRLTTALAMSPVASQTQDALTAGEPQELYLAVTLNGVRHAKLAPFALSPEGLEASAVTLRGLGLRWPGSEVASGVVPLKSLPGSEVTYDRAGQQVRMEVPVALLDRAMTRLSSGLDVPSAPANPEGRMHGVLFNYDLYAQGTGGRATASAWSEMRLFGAGPGIWSNSMVTRLGERDSLTNTNVRLDTSWQLAFPQEMLTISAGDSLTSALSWSRAIRIGGARVSRNFALQPYRITTPLESFRGEAALPSTVDLYINGLRKSSQQVQPGQFQLDALPSLNGVGVAQMVITDINGHRRSVNFDFYGMPSLLQAGLWDWSLETGFVRKDYGVRSSSYDHDLMASGSSRYGLSNRTTMEFHAQATRGLQLAGAGAVLLLPAQAGAISASAAASRSGASTGFQHGVGYQWNALDYSIALNSIRRSDAYRDVVSRFDTDLSRGTDTVFGGFGSLLGQWGVSYSRQLFADKPPLRLATLSWSQEMPGHSTLSVNGMRDLGSKDTKIFAAWSMPLDRRRSVSMSAVQGGGRSSFAVDTSQSASEGDGGWGWRVQAGLNDGGSSGQAQVTRMFQAGQWSAGVSRAASAKQPAYSGSGNGSVVWMDGGLHALRRVDDAFAMVSTDGVPDVPVRLENRLVGRTDASGRLFVPQLNAYQRNQFAIDTLELAVEMRADRVTAESVPESRSGTVVRFGLRRVTSVQAVLQDERGELLPAGSEARLVGGSKTDAAAKDASSIVVGYDGLVYLEDPPKGAVLRVKSQTGECTVILPDLPPGPADLGRLSCHR